MKNVVLPRGVEVRSKESLGHGCTLGTAWLRPLVRVSCASLLVSLVACAGAPPTPQGNGGLAHEDSTPEDRGPEDRGSHEPTRDPSASGSSRNDEFPASRAGDPGVESEKPSGADRLQAFLDQLRIEDQERRAASRESLRQARALSSELKYEEAARVLQRALHSDRENEELRRFLDQLRFLLGDRAGEISQFTQELREQAKVRDQQVISELHMMYEKGVRLLDSGEYDEAVKVLDRLLSRLDHYESSGSLQFQRRAKSLREQASRKQP